VRNWEEFSATLDRQGSDSPWGAVRAFARLAARSDYDTTKNIFDHVTALGNDELSVEAVANAAIAAGRRGDVTSYLARLKQLAGERGNWGSAWTSKAKQRYHKLNVWVHGEPGRRAAFDAFVDDLAQRRESIDNLFPVLDDVLELLSPRPSWAEAWARLEDHLSHFREYRIGRAVDAPAATSGSDAETLADILFRAIDTTATELTDMARAASIELCETASGSAVVAALLPRLWRAGGHAAFEAVRIAWECRDVPTVCDAVMPWFLEMADSNDFAIRRTAISLARAWMQELPIKRGRLPAIYELELPQNPQADRFEPPSGTSSFSSGLWTDDPYAWTWPLEDALSLTAEATGLDRRNLRAHAAQLMARMGGRDAFGPEAVERQQRRFRRLSLHVGYRKHGVEAAFRATRAVVGELVAAEAIDPKAVPLILQRSAGFAMIVATMPPSPRPFGVSRVTIGDVHRTEIAAWRESAIQDAVEPRVGGFRVLASTAVHTRRHFRDEKTVEQYSGPDVGSATEGLWRQLTRLPRVIIADRVACLYDGLAQGAVVHPEPDMGISVGPHLVMLCPRVAAKLGWLPDPNHVFRYLDRHGQVVAQTVWWRDGGVFAHESDSEVRSQGYLLLVPEDAAKELEPFLAKAQTVRAWHVTGKPGEEA
jgi:hypothetical protein